MEAQANRLEARQMMLSHLAQLQYNATQTVTNAAGSDVHCGASWAEKSSPGHLTESGDRKTLMRMREVAGRKDRSGGLRRVEAWATGLQGDGAAQHVPLSSAASKALFSYCPSAACRMGPAS